VPPCATQIDPSSDLVLTWERGAPGVDAWVQATQTVDGSPRGILCVADSTLGAMTIPAAVLARLVPGTSFQLFTFGTTTVVAGDYDVSVYVGTEIEDVSGDPVGLELPGTGGTGGAGGTSGQ